ncbi:hypothetical protein NMG60_11033086 [Bertholletia excelsa]
MQISFVLLLVCGTRSISSNYDMLTMFILKLQGIVLLIILISGLCCMAGIDTPTRWVL